MTEMRQLSFALAPPPQFNAEDFIEDATNAAALRWLARREDWPERRLALWGPASSGKTHLLHLWAARTGAALLSGPALRAAPPAGALAIDDADAAPERPLLHGLNAAAEAGFATLLAGRTAPARWRVALPDLASRLRAITAVAIEPAGEDLLRVLLARLLSDRQLVLSDALQDWLLHHLPRTPASLREAVARLDRAALAAGRRVTRPFAAAELADLIEPADADEDFAQSPAAASSSAPGFL